MFPAGLPGTALLLLRISIGGLLSVTALSNEAAGKFASWKALFLCVTCVLLLLGALTPLASASSIAIEATYWSGTESLESLRLALIMLVSLTIFILGPGAYSIDSRHFGRRLILPASKAGEDSPRSKKGRPS
jgi:hypothetical protein